MGKDKGIFINCILVSNLLKIIEYKGQLRKNNLSHLIGANGVEAP